MHVGKGSWKYSMLNLWYYFINHTMPLCCYVDKKKFKNKAFKIFFDFIKIKFNTGWRIIRLTDLTADRNQELVRRHFTAVQSVTFWNESTCSVSHFPHLLPHQVLSSHWPDGARGGGGGTLLTRSSQTMNKQNSLFYAAPSWRRFSISFGCVHRPKEEKKKK